MATHKARHMLDNMEVHKDIESALAPFSVIAATTARRGRKRIMEKTPRELVEAVLPDLPNNQFAIMFGPEDTGLTNEEIKYCHYVSAIPTAGFSSFLRNNLRILALNSLLDSTKMVLTPYKTW